MSEAAYVEEAAGWAEKLIRKTRLHCFAGDLDEAMTEASRRFRISYRTFWKLRYRKPKTISVGVYMRIKEAYENECLRQEAKLRDELATFEKIMGPAAASDPAYRAAKAALVAMERAETE